MSYLSRNAWGEGRYGYYNHENPNAYGAHNLAPNPNAGRPAFGHYENMGKKPPVELNEDLSNLDEVLQAIGNMEGIGQP